MRKWLVVIWIGIGLALAGWWGYVNLVSEWFNPKGKEVPVAEGELAKYDFDHLRLRPAQVSQIEILGPIEEIEKRRENCKGKWCMEKEELAKFATRQISFMTGGKKMTGMINLPLTPFSNQKPAVIMIRGYADTAGYYSGSGSWRAADKLAAAGWVTVSLDFLGFAGSDKPSDDILEARFEKVPAVLDLIESVKKLGFVDASRIGLWAHSNGGQIALSVLAVSGQDYPLTMWAPMTNPFPQSVYETINDDEPGRIVKARFEEFGKQYDFRNYAFENYYDWIKAPVIIHQGTADVWCKVEWQRSVVDGLTTAGAEAKLYVYQGDDHNLSKNWGEVINRDIEFLKMML